MRNASKMCYGVAGILCVTLLEAENPPVVDLSGPDYTPPDAPAWIQEVKPEWIRPWVGLNGTPPEWRRWGNVMGRDVKGLDRWMANHYIFYRPETAEYLYAAYSPTTVNYSKGLLPSYEKAVETFTAGCTNDLERGLALLTRAMPQVLRHPGMPPLGKPVPPDRNLDDEALLATGSGWCNEQARVFIRLCQVAGIPARMIHLFGQNHTIAEFYAGGGWIMADASNFFAVPSKEGKWLSAAECHDGGEGQRAYAEAKAKRMAELIEMPDEALGFSDPVRAAAWKKSAPVDVDELAKRPIAFGVVNYPLPPRGSSLSE